MKYLFATIYVLGASIILLNLLQLATLGWNWEPVIRIFIAILWLIGNYYFSKEAYKAKNQRNNRQPKK